MTARRTIIRGGLILDAQGRAALQDVLIEDGRRQPRTDWTG
jgi:hypothetical protein